MRKLNVTLVVLMACAFLPAMAQAEEGGKGKKKKRGNREEFRKRLLQRFDKNGDGRLNEEERAAARKAREKFQAGRGKKKKGRGGDARRRPNDRRRPNGKGRRPNSDRPNPRALQQLRRTIIQYFDQNRNGRLDPPERERFLKLLSGRQGGGRKGKGNADRRRRRPGADGAGKKRRGNRAGADRRRRPDGEAAVKRPGLLDKAELLKKYDTNRNGKLDPAERRKAIQDKRKK